MIGAGRRVTPGSQRDSGLSFSVVGSEYASSLVMRPKSVSSAHFGTPIAWH